MDIKPPSILIRLTHDLIGIFSIFLPIQMSHGAIGFLCRKQFHPFFIGRNPIGQGQQPHDFSHAYMVTDILQFCRIEVFYNSLRIAAIDHSCFQFFLGFRRPAPHKCRTAADQQCNGCKKGNTPFFRRHIKNIFKSCFQFFLPTGKSRTHLHIFAVGFLHRPQDGHAVGFSFFHTAIFHDRQIAGKFHILFRSFHHPMDKGIEKMQCPRQHQNAFEPQVFPFAVGQFMLQNQAQVAFFPVLGIDIDGRLEKSHTEGAGQWFAEIDFRPLFHFHFPAEDVIRIQNSRIHDLSAVSLQHFLEGKIFPPLPSKK